MPKSADECCRANHAFLSDDIYCGAPVALDDEGIVEHHGLQPISEARERLQTRPQWPIQPLSARMRNNKRERWKLGTILPNMASSTG